MIMATVSSPISKQSFLVMCQESRALTAQHQRWRWGLARTRPL